jgi:hypothetical protein
MSDLVKQLQHLSPEKRELFELHLKEKREQKQRAAAKPITPARRRYRRASAFVWPAAALVCRSVGAG